MLVSAKGRYALRVIIDLAEHNDGNYIAMKDVANRQDVSLKYLEKILPILVKNDLVVGVHGKGGGYKLTGKPEDYRVGDILRLTEGDLAPCRCMTDNPEPCAITADCKTRPMWDELNSIVNDYLDTVTIADLINNKA